MNKILPLLFLLLGSAVCYGQMEEYRYKRTIEGAKQGWHSISLPNDLYAQLTEHLSDIRIFGLTATGDTLEMPYLLKDGAAEIKYQDISFHLINQTKNQQGYYYTLEVPKQLPLNEIKLQFGNQNFDWRVILEGSHNQREWFTILEDYRILSVENDYTDYSFTTLRFPTIQYKYLRLQIKSDQKPELMPVNLLKKEQTTADYQLYPIQHFNIVENRQEKQTIADIKLPQMVPVSFLSLEVKDTLDYYRPISILYPADSSKGQKGWQYHYRTLYTGTLSSLEPADFSFPTAITSRLRVIIDHGHNLPLKIKRAEVKGYHYSLTSRLGEADNYFLVYGKSNASTPSYDIVLFTDKIPAQLPELQLGPEELVNTQNLPAVSPLFSNKLWLWLIMFVLIGLMGWFTLKMLKAEQPGNQA